MTLATPTETASENTRAENVRTDKVKVLPFDWPEEGVTRIPFQIFSDPAVYKLEQERIFRGPVWHFLCLELDLKEPGDYRTSFIGDTPIIAVKDRDGEINAMVNRCAHKGALVCHKERGNAKALSCVYHSWTYDLSGQLMGLAFRDGLRGKGWRPGTSSTMASPIRSKRCFRPWRSSSP